MKLRTWFKIRIKKLMNKQSDIKTTLIHELVEWVFQKQGKELTTRETFLLLLIDEKHGNLSFKQNSKDLWHIRHLISIIDDGTFEILERYCPEVQDLISQV